MDSYIKHLKDRPLVFFVFIIVLLSGFVYRLYLSTFAARGLFWDMADYDNFAREILSGRLVVDCCNRNVGYSAFLALIYLFFGISNLTMVRVIQIFLDLFSAVLIFLVAKQLFGRKAAWISFVLYVTNPFTSSYTGLILPESITIFYVCLIMFVVTRVKFIKAKWLWMFLGVLLGFLVFTRSQFYYFSFIMLFIFAILVFQKLYKLLFFLIAISAFFLSSLYTLVGNLQNYKVISLIPPYNIGTAGLYAMFYIGKYPEINWGKINPGYVKITDEYYNTPLEEKKEFYDKYKQLYLEKVRKEWPLYLSIIGSHIYWIWDKDHLYTYVDPFYPKDSLYLRIYNLIILTLFIVGLTSFVLKKGKIWLRSPPVIFTLLFFLYITFVITLLSNESRHALPFYPLVFLWGGYGLMIFTKLFIKDG